MARMQGSSVTIGGKTGNYIFTDWGVASQNEDGNYSTINWATYFHYNAADAQLDNGRTDASVGALWVNGGRVHNYGGNFSTRDILLANGSFNIGHDGNGNQNLAVSGGIDVYQVGRSSGSGTWGLPGLYQAINYNSIQFLNVNDVGFQVYVSVDRTADLLQLSIDGGGWTTYYAGGYTAVTVSIGGSATPIVSGKDYTVRVRTRRASNGWVTDSGTYTVSVTSQNNFFDSDDF